MSITVTGKVEQSEIGIDTWALVTEEGETYELMDPPEQLCQSRTKVKVEGQVRDDVMTIAAIGPVLQINSFEVLEN
ncbi:MAG: hypothetical protein QNJ54_32145 [Prochloraceae cyanobacterium]|nr:hypothetical protein [Prochloraceae cyanobacterium]